MTFASARSSRPGVGEHARERPPETSTSTAPSARAEAAERGGEHLLEPDRRRADLERARLEAAHVEQVADERVQPVGLLVDRAQEVVARLGRPLDVLLEQARDGGLDAGERRAQVVRHGGEERGPQLVGGGERHGGLRIGLELPELEGGARAPSRRRRARADPRCGSDRPRARARASRRARSSAEPRLGALRHAVAARGLDAPAAPPSGRAQLRLRARARGTGCRGRRPRATSPRAGAAPRPPPRARWPSTARRAAIETSG